jgi:hypothetical protein
MEDHMNIPRAVREQADRAEAAHQALLGNTAPAAAPQAPEPTPPVETPTEPAEPVAPAQPVVAETQPVQPAADKWELKYRVLEGKYRAEVPRLQGENSDLKSENARLTEQLRVAQQRSAGDSSLDEDDAVTPDSVVSTYGEDFAKAVDAIAESKTKKLQEQLEGLTQDTVNRRRQDFFRDLTAYVPQWTEIDKDAAFTAFLDEFDTLTGRTRREFFNEADRANDAARVASFFSSFARGQATALAPVRAPVVPSVEHLISPDSTASSEAPPGKKLWTRPEVARFYAESRAQGGDKQFGRYTRAEFERIDADINAAIAEGRLAP